MDQCQQDLRRAAARAFVESLEQLHETFQKPDEHPAKAENHPLAPPPPPVSSSCFDLNSFEQAVADIEQFMNQKDALQG